MHAVFSAERLTRFIAEEAQQTIRARYFLAQFMPGEEVTKALAAADQQADKYLLETTSQTRKALGQCAWRVFYAQQIEDLPLFCTLVGRSHIPPAEEISLYSLASAVLLDTHSEHELNLKESILATINSIQEPEEFPY